MFKGVKSINIVRTSVHSFVRKVSSKTPSIPAMVITTTPQPVPASALVDYLRRDIGLSEDALALGVRQAIQEQAPLPVTLWRFGLLNLGQLDQVLDWQDGQS